LVDKQLVEKIKEAIDTAKPRKFLESIEVAINLKDIDLTNPKNRINEEIILPKGRGKKIKIGVFGSGELAVKARKEADLVILSEELDTLVEDKKKAKQMVIDHDFFIAEAPLMPIIGKRLGIYLGTRGKMPKPMFHVTIGTRNMKIEEMAENLEAVIKRLESKLERGRMNIASMYIKTTMGPAVRII